MMDALLYGGIGTPTVSAGFTRPPKEGMVTMSRRVAGLVALAVGWSIVVFIISVAAPIWGGSTTISMSSPSANSVRPTPIVLSTEPRETILKIAGYRTVGLLSG